MRRPSTKQRKRLDALSTPDLIAETVRTLIPVKEQPKGGEASMLSVRAYTALGAVLLARGYPADGSVSLSARRGFTGLKLGYGTEVVEIPYTT